MSTRTPRERRAQSVTSRPRLRLEQARQLRERRHANGHAGRRERRAQGTSSHRNAGMHRLQGGGRDRGSGVRAGLPPPLNGQEHGIERRRRVSQGGSPAKRASDPASRIHELRSVSDRCHVDLRTARLQRSDRYKALLGKVERKRLQPRQRLTPGGAATCVGLPGRLRTRTFNGSHRSAIDEADLLDLLRHGVRAAVRPRMSALRPSWLSIPAKSRSAATIRHGRRWGEQGGDLRRLGRP